MSQPIAIEYDVYLTRTADKAQRKLDKPLRQRIQQALQAIALNPESIGEALCSPLSTIYSYHMNYQGKEYRIAYTIEQETCSVLVLLIGPHENFYRRLQQHVYAT